MSTSCPVTENTPSLLLSCSSGDSFPHSYAGMWVATFEKHVSSSPELEKTFLTMHLIFE